jgi:hypothetical protein
MVIDITLGDFERLRPRDRIRERPVIPRGENQRNRNDGTE